MGAEITTPMPALSSCDARAAPVTVTSGLKRRALIIRPGLRVAVRKSATRDPPSRDPRPPKSRPATPQVATRDPQVATPHEPANPDSYCTGIYHSSGKRGFKQLAPQQNYHTHLEWINKSVKRLDKKRLMSRGELPARPPHPR